MSARHGGTRVPGSGEAAVASHRRARVRVGVVVGLVGLVVTAASSWTAWKSDRATEHRLLQIQTLQAGNLIGSAILGIEGPLSTSVQVAAATGGNAQAFDRSIGFEVGPGRLFVSASLWRTSDHFSRPLATVGAPAELVPASAAAHTFVSRATRSSTIVVVGIPQNQPERIGYAVASKPGARYVVYAERAIPANRQVPVESDSAFAELDYATYLGPGTQPSRLATTDVPPGELPLHGYTARDSIPFGDSTLTLVATARGHLGGRLGATLPWIFLLGGTLLTLAAALVAEQFARRRRRAEDDANTITTLYERVDALYGEQRSIAETLQHALLPQSNPAVPNLEIATRYVAGMDGVDIGGDWYSAVLLDDRHFAFVVGDVSGRGIDAATIMARLRFTIRAYLVEGHPPGIALALCARQLDIERDGHFATVLVGIGDVDSRELTLASAGHLNPLVVSGGRADFVEVDAGVPLGISSDTYATTTLAIAPGATFLAFTDGLVERRGEGIDTGLRRLAEAATAAAPTLDDLLTSLIDGLVRPGATDDVAVIAFRWID